MPEDVLLAGGTGVVGRELARELAAREDVGVVHLLARRPPPDDFPIPKPKMNLILLENFADLGKAPWDSAPRLGAAFIALGTTLKKVGGNRQAFREVDFEHVLRVARWMRNSQVPFAAVVSAVGADPRSSFFYSRVKGEMELALRELAFAHLVIARPSLLLGARAEHRRGEEWAKRLAPRLFPLLEKASPALGRYRPVEASCVARSLVLAWLSVRGEMPREVARVRVLEGDDLQAKAPA